MSLIPFSIFRSIFLISLRFTARLVNFILELGLVVAWPEMTNRPLLLDVSELCPDHHVRGSVVHLSVDKVFNRMSKHDRFTNKNYILILTVDNQVIRLYQDNVVNIKYDCNILKIGTASHGELIAYPKFMLPLVVNLIDEMY